MRIDMELLRLVYDRIVETEDIYKINDYVGINENEIATFEDFKDYFVSSILANLQYDLGVQMNLHTLIKEEL